MGGVTSHSRGLEKPARPPDDPCSGYPTWLAPQLLFHVDQMSIGTDSGELVPAVCSWHSVLHVLSCRMTPSPVQAPPRTPLEVVEPRASSA